MMGSISVKTLTLGELDTNCYLVWCETTRQALIIDPADAGEAIVDEILALQLQPTAIVLTHAHFDHVLGMLAVKLSLDIPAYLHPADSFLLEEAQKSAEHWLKHPADPVPPADLPLEEYQEISFGECSLRVIHTPGHTPGSCSLLFDNRSKQANKEHFMFSEQSVLFVGDLIFENGVGRTDFRYSNNKQLWQSIEKLRSNYRSALCYAGHGEPFTLQ